MGIPKEHKTWIHLTNGSGGMKSESDILPSPLYNLSAPHLTPAPAEVTKSMQVSTRFKQVQSDSIQPLPSSPCPHTHHLLLQSFLMPTKALDPTDMHLQPRTAAESSFMGHSWPLGTEAIGHIFLHFNPKQIDLRLLYMAPKKCWGIKHPLPSTMVIWFQLSHLPFSFPRSSTPTGATSQINYLHTSNYLRLCSPGDPS